MEIRIRVGAALDANVAGLFRPWVEAAKKARQQIDAELGKLGKGGGGAGGGVKKAIDDQVRATKDGADKISAINDRALRQQAADLMRNLAIRKRAMADQAREEERLARDDARRARDKERALDHVRGIRERYEGEQRRAAEREMRQQDSFGRRTSYRTVHHFANTLRAGGAVAMDIARGAGVETNIGSLVGQAVRLQSQAVALSNSAFQNREGEKRSDPRELIGESKGIADQYGFSRESVIGGLRAFTAKTGELDVGRKALAGLAELAKATATNLDDMVGAAGEADKALGATFTDPTEKAEALNRIMRVIAAQGKIGSVEISSLATQLGKVAAGASAFSGNRETVIEKLGALAQMAIQGGGAASATQAATSVAGFVNTLKTPTRVKQFTAHQIDVFANRKEGKLKDPFELILEALKKTKGDPMEMKKMFSSVVGAKPVESLAATYRDAGGGAAGEKAVRDRMATFMRGMTQADVRESATRATATTESKVQQFNNKLEDVGERIAERVLPQMERLAPAIVQVVDNLGRLAGWAAENPWKAIFSALGVSVARAAGEAMLRSGIESTARAVFGGATAGAGGAGVGGAGQFVAAPGGKLGAAVGALGSALAITAAAVTIAEVGMLTIDKVLEQGEKASENTQEALTTATSSRLAYDASAQAGAPSPQSIKDMEAQRDLMIARINAAHQQQKESAENYGVFGGALSGALNYVTGGAVGTSFDAQTQRSADADKLQEMKEELAKLNQKIGGALKVEVTNLPTAAPQPSGPREGIEGMTVFPGL